ncbi:putrescine-ornithine antiporter, partial [Clostridioides difficile]|nr:putrescine-ornithine antiporter [Clostridioides difficile]
MATAMWTIVVLWVATILNFGGANITGRISTFTVWGVILPVIFISIVGWFYFSGSSFATSWNPHNYSFIEGMIVPSA